MPTRIVREGIITSEPINRLSESAENFYRRLMSVADDYGRYYAHPSLLRGACYPLQLDRITDAKVGKNLAECVSEKLIILYQGGKYLQVVKFNQQCRSRSKFPEPLESELLINGVSNDNHLPTQTDEGRLAPTTTTHTSPTSISSPTSYPPVLDFPEFHTAWGDWNKHLKEKRCGTTPSAIEKQLEFCANLGIVRAVAAIQFSIRGSYQSIFEPKDRNGSSHQKPVIDYSKHEKF